MLLREVVVVVVTVVVGACVGLAPPPKRLAGPLLRRKEPFFFSTVEEPGFFSPPPPPYATLGIVTALWGSQHTVIKSVVGDGGGVPALTAARFCVAAACLAPWTPRDPETWRRGAELGLWAFAGFALQAVGLETTTATRSAFLLYLNVKLVPVLGWVIDGARPTAATWASALVALCGTILLCANDNIIDGGGGGGGDDALFCFTVGDAWCVAAALASAVFIVRLEKLGDAHISAAGLTSASATTTAALAALWYCCWNNNDNSGAAVIDDPALSWDLLGAALYLGAVPSALCGYLQTVAQRSVPAARAAVVYATDPLWAALFARLVLDERLGPQAIAGGTLIAAAALSQRLRESPASSQNDDDDDDDDDDGDGNDLDNPGTSIKHNGGDRGPSSTKRISPSSSLSPRATSSAAPLPI